MLALGWATPAAWAVTIELDYTYDGSGFFDDPARRATLEAAAAAWEHELEGVMLPEIPAGVGINTWTLSFNRPDQAATLAQAKNTQVVNRPIAANTIVIYVGARSDVYGGYLGFAEFSYSAFGTPPWLKVFQDRNNSDQFYSFGGAVTFDSDANWHFDAEPESKEEFPGQYDFYSIALHEIGHLLGFTPDVPVFARQTMGGNFSGPAAVALYGSAPPFGIGGHWPVGFEFDGKGMVMLVNQAPNTRHHINPLEVAILKDLGYTVKGAVRVTLEPPAAVAAGARWQVNDGEEQLSDVTLEGVPVGEALLELKAVPGFVTPAAQTIEVVAGETVEVVVTYQPILVPEIVQRPVSQWVELGQTVTLEVEAAAGEAEIFYQWRKAGKSIKNARASELTYANAGLAVGGRYEVAVRTAAGPAASFPAANLGVVGGVRGPSVVNEGARLTLTQAAAGPGVTYQWLRDGLALENNATAGVAGADRARLVLSKVNGTAAGVYQCRMQMADAESGDLIEQLGPEHEVAVTLRPVVDEVVLGPWRVGGGVTDVVTAQNGATRFSVVGLPAGVVLNATTGQLSGKPRLARTYRLSITAHNAAGRSVPKSVEVLCDPFPAMVQGNFDGIIDRAAVNAQLGGMVKATVAGTAAVSGQLSLGRNQHRFSGRLDTLPGPDATAVVTIRRGRGQSDLTLNLLFDATTGRLTGTVTDGDQPPATLEAWRNPWHRQTAPATAWEGAYTAAIRPQLPEVIEVDDVDIPEEPPLIPRGAGFVTARVSRAGMVSWSGRLADGAAFTRTTMLSETGVSGFHALLYGGTGSVQGWNEWQPAEDEEAVTQLDGGWDWFKYIQLNAKAINYKGGFPLHELTVTGSMYDPPQRGVRVLSIGAEPERNARLRFAEGGLDSAVFGDDASIDFTLTTANKMLTLPALENPAQTRLAKLVPASGLFQGSYVLQDPRPGGGRDVTRKVAFYGLLVPRLGKGYGYFLLPELTNLKPAPVLSGEVVLEPVEP